MAQRAAVMLAAAIACAIVWSAPVVSAAAIATSAIFVQSAAALACGSDAGCPAVRLSLLALGAALFLLGIHRDRAAPAEQTAVSPDHAFWYSMFGLIVMDSALVQIFAWDTLEGVLFLALQGVSLALSVQVGRSVLSVLSAIGAVVYIEAQIIRAFSGSPLAGPLAAVLLGTAALYAGILVRRRGGRVRARLRGSIWL